MSAAEGSMGAAVRTMPRRASVVRRLARDRAAVVGGSIVVVLVLAALLAPWLAPQDPNLVDAPNRLAGPSTGHPFGTDMLGRDILSRLLHGGRWSISMAIVASLGISVVGLVVGVSTGMLGGAFDALLMRVVDVMQSIPTLLVALVTISVWGAGVTKLVAAFVLVGWPGYARVVRSATLALRERPFVDAARSVGSSRLRVMTRHIVPNLVGPVTVLTTLDLGRILLGLTALSFLGFGVDPATPEWGRMLSDARRYFYLAPRLLVYPGMAISAFVLAVNLFGDGLRDALDVKLGPR